MPSSRPTAMVLGPKSLDPEGPRRGLAPGTGRTVAGTNRSRRTRASDAPPGGGGGAFGPGLGRVGALALDLGGECGERVAAHGAPDERGWAHQVRSSSASSSRGAAGARGVRVRVRAAIRPRERRERRRSRRPVRTSIPRARRGRSRRTPRREARRGRPARRRVPSAREADGIVTRFSFDADAKKRRASRRLDRRPNRDRLGPTVERARRASPSACGAAAGKPAGPRRPGRSDLFCFLGGLRCCSPGESTV